MMIRRQRSQARRGAAVVEMCFACMLLFLMMFGIFEYCRLLFIWHVADNAARDAARFAVVHTGGGTMPGEPATISASDVTTVAQTGMFNGTAYGAGLCGMDNNIQGLSITVFTVDPAGLAASPVVVQPLSGSQWNTGSFGQNIAVQISGSYKPVLPSLLFMNSTVPFQVTVMMSTEAN
jgi:Flp pilus assembly protein TadG